MHRRKFIKYFALVALLAYMTLSIGAALGVQGTLLASKRRDALPVGIIVLLDSVSVPAGWERFTSADSKHIVGAGSTYAVGETGGAQASITQTTSLSGDHDGTGFTVNFVKNSGAGTLPGGHYSITAGGGGNDGAHIHTLTANYDMAYRQMLLIRSTATHTRFPADSAIFGSTGSSPVAGLSIIYDDEVALVSGSSVTTGGGAYTNTDCNDGGDPATNHLHETQNTYYDPTGASTAYSYFQDVIGSDHTFTPALVSQTLKKTYLAAWKGSSEFRNATGVIAMWESATPPPGWYLCDGNNGTIDMRDYFVMLGSVGTAGDQDDEANQIITSFSIDDDDWTHSHIGDVYNNINATGYVSGRHSSFDATHGHTAANDTQAYVPPYYALTFIQRN